MTFIDTHVFYPLSNVLSEMIETVTSIIRYLVYAQLIYFFSKYVPHTHIKLTFAQY